MLRLWRARHVGASDPRRVPGSGLAVRALRRCRYWRRREIPRACEIRAVSKLQRWGCVWAIRDHSSQPIGFSSANARAATTSAAALWWVSRGGGGEGARSVQPRMTIGVSGSRREEFDTRGRRLRSRTPAQALREALSFDALPPLVFLLHTFTADVLACTPSRGRMRVVATIGGPRRHPKDSHPPRAPDRGVSAPAGAVRPVRLELTSSAGAVFPR